MRHPSAHSHSKGPCKITFDGGGGKLYETSPNIYTHIQLILYESKATGLGMGRAGNIYKMSARWKLSTIDMSCV